MTDGNRQSYRMKEDAWQSRIRMREIYRYMGMRETDVDSTLQKTVKRQLDRLLEAASVRSYYRIFPLRFQEDTEQDEERTPGGQKAFPAHMELGPMVIHSQALGKNLKGCDHAALFGVTLGLDVDRLIYRLGRTAVGEAVIVDACAAEAVEVVCDELCDKLKEEASAMGRRTRPRFSPGFGDFTLEYQPALLQALELPKRIGINLTAGGMMTPTKSVTAVVGFYDPAVSTALYDRNAQ